jgi:hypothetical protein
METACPQAVGGNRSHIFLLSTRACRLQRKRAGSKEGAPASMKLARELCYGERA